MKKQCNRCLVEKSVNEFHKRGEKWQPYCKSCKQIKDKKYAKNKAIKSKEYKVKFRKWATSFKEGKPCTDCGRSFHFAAMQWDHLPKYKKEFNIGPASDGSVSKERYLAEIAKCELVCANCHAVRTVNRREGLE